MKITVKQLKRIIQEELQTILNEVGYGAQSQKANPRMGGVYKDVQTTRTDPTTGTTTDVQDISLQGAQPGTGGKKFTIDSKLADRSTSGGGQAIADVTTQKMGTDMGTMSDIMRREQPTRGTRVTTTTDPTGKSTTSEKEYETPGIPGAKLTGMSAQTQQAESLKRMIEEMLVVELNSKT